jgi:hypothetical protein
MTKAAGVSDEAVRKATGKDWKEWFTLLDKAGARKLDHKGIVALVGGKGAGPWWQQMVAVAYEQERGLREKYQKAGGFSAGASKTIGVPLAKVYRAFQARVKREPGVEIRKATLGKSMRLTWNDGTRVSVYFSAKSDVKSQVAIEHEKLAGQKDVAQRKKYWGEFLASL